MKLLAASIIALAFAIVTLAVVIVVVEGREHHSPTQDCILSSGCVGSGTTNDPFGSDTNDPFSGNDPFGP